MECPAAKLFQEKIEELEKQNKHLREWLEYIERKAEAGRNKNSGTTLGYVKVWAKEALDTIPKGGG